MEVSSFMSWYKDLYDTYEALEASGKVGEMKKSLFRFNNSKDGQVSILAPLYVDKQKADLIITLRLEENGEVVFESAKNCTEHLPILIHNGSSSRTSKAANHHPHALHDKLLYFLDEQIFQEYYRPILNNWIASDYGNKRVEKILEYLDTGQLKYRLREEKIISENEKIQDKDLKKFTFFDLKDSQNGYEHRVYYDPEILKSWSSYAKYIERQNSGIDYVTGREMALQNPKYTKKYIGNTKMISSQDSKGLPYIFKGLLKETEEAVSFGVESVQKVENMLDFLLAIVTPYGIGGRNYTIWNKVNPNKKLDSPIADDDPFIQTQEMVYEIDEIYAYHNFLKNRGYDQHIDLKEIANETIVYLVTEKSSDGRLGIVDYQNFTLKEYYQRFLSWHNDGAIHLERKEKWEFGTIKFIEIAKFTSKDIQKRVLHDLTKSLLNEASIPRYIDELLLRNWSINHIKSREDVKKKAEDNQYQDYLRYMEVLASVARLSRRQKTGGKKVLNERNRDRSYLFGRLLAVADKIERDARFDKFKKTENQQKGKYLATNAMRYQSAFAQRPSQTWMRLELKLAPYFVNLEGTKAIHYQSLIDQIMNQFEELDFNSEQPLNSMYALGFHQQRFSFYQNPGEEKKDDIENIND